MSQPPKKNGAGSNGASNGGATREVLVAERPALPDDDASPAALRAFETVRRFLESDRWYPKKLGDHYILRVNYAARHGTLRCYAQVRVDMDQVVFYVVAPVKAPEDVRAEVAEFITRANYGMRIGNFELDYGDGEVRYKSALDFEDTELAEQLVKNLVYPAVSTMDRYLPGLLSVIARSRTPLEAVADIEGD